MNEAENVDAIGGLLEEVMAWTEDFTDALDRAMSIPRGLPAAVAARDQTTAMGRDLLRKIEHILEEIEKG